jgi:hypothetical protein
MFSKRKKTNICDSTSQQKLRWYQYRLRSLFILTFLVSVFMSWFTVKLNQAKRQKAAIEALTGDFAGDVEYEPSSSYIPDFLRDKLGEDFFSDVSCLKLYLKAGNSVIDEAKYTHLVNLPGLRKISFSCLLQEDKHRPADIGLHYLLELEKLKELDLADNWTIDDIKTLGKMPQLAELSLTFDGDSLTENNIEQIQKLIQVKKLHIECTEECKVNLRLLKPLTNLWSLYLQGITCDSDLGSIQELVQIRQLTFESCPSQVSDSGLEYIKKLSNLESLYLSHSKCFTLSGIIGLKSMAHLRKLGVDAYYVSSSDLDTIRRAMPNVFVILINII